jgi:hypothetical protein
MDIHFLCLNKDSWRYPTKHEFRQALGDIDVKVVAHEFFLNLEPVPYFEVFFNQKDVDYLDWCQNERIIVSRLWKYSVHKIEHFKTALL